VVVDAIAGVGAIIEREKPRASIALRDLLRSPIVPLSLDKSGGYAEQSSRAMMNVLRFKVGQRAPRSIGTIGGEQPARMTPSPLKPNRWYNAVLAELLDSR
jgi:hypothetical protein